MKLSRLLAAAAAPALLLGAVAAPSYADDVSNNIDDDIDVTAETMPLNVGGPAGTTDIYIHPRNGDSDTGCNFEGGSEAMTASVTSSDTTVATVSPSTVTFTSCGDIKTLAVTPVGVGTANVTLAQTANNTGGTFNFAPATFQVVVAPPANSAPSVSISGVSAGATYPKGSVPSAMCDVSDAEDGNSSFAADLSEVSGTYAAVGIGSQIASCSYTDAGGLMASSSATYDIVPVPNTAPTVSVTGVADGEVYELGSVPAAGCDVSDAEDTDPTATPVVDDPIGDHSDVGLGEQTVTCSYTDGGDITGQNKLSDDDSVTYTIVPVPNTAPEVTISGVTNGGSYNKGSVPVAMCDVVDAEDGDSSFPADLSEITGPYASDGIGSRTASCSHTDNGNIIGEDKLSDDASATYDIVDPTAPDIDYTVSPAGPDGDNDWYVSDVSVDWTVDEPESPNSLTTSGCDGFDITADQAGTTYTCSASSAGGDNEVSTVSIKRDATDPSLDVSGGPADGGSYFWGSVPDAPTCTADDNLSGVVAAGCTVSGYSSAIGQHTVTVIAKDNAGNTTTVSRTYSVKAWTVKGFYAPVDMGGVYNTVKGGSTVPLKFELFAGTELTDVGAIASFKTQKITCTGSPVEDAIEVLSTGGTSLRYDSTAGQFIQNWKTPTGAGTCYSATMTADDGSFVTAYFKLK